MRGRCHVRMRQEPTTVTLMKPSTSDDGSGTPAVNTQTVPSLAAPPDVVVPYRLPWASKVTPPVGSAPLPPLNEAMVVSPPARDGAETEVEAKSAIQIQSADRAMIREFMEATPWRRTTLTT